MTEQEQRIAIAEACGYQQPDTSFPLWVEGVEPFRYIPDYPRDLNAMHSAEKHGIATLFEDRRKDFRDYVDWLVKITEHINPVDATAAQRAEAFLRTLGKWKETP